EMVTFVSAVAERAKTSRPRAAMTAIKRCIPVLHEWNAGEGDRIFGHGHGEFNYRRNVLRIAVALAIVFSSLLLSSRLRFLSCLWPIVVTSSLRHWAVSRPCPSALR